MTKIQFLSLSLIALTLTGCGKDDDKPAAKTTVALEEVTSPDGCLALPEYFQRVRAMDQGTPVVQATTKLELRSKYAIRENFRRQLAYGIGRETVLEPKPLSDLPDFQNVSQEACTKLTINDPDGQTRDLKIVASSKESVKAEDDKGLGFEYTWLSPQRMKVTHTYSAYDLPCGSRDTAITVVHTKTLDWSGGAPDVVEMDSSFVSGIAEFVGGDAATAYTDAGGTRAVSLNQLRNLLNMDPRPEMLTCSGQPAPATPPAPTPAPTPTPDQPNENNSPSAPPGPDAPAPAPEGNGTAPTPGEVTPVPEETVAPAAPAETVAPAAA